MESSEIKIKIYKKIDLLSSEKLNELYGLISNFVQGQVDREDWESMSDEQKTGLLAALEEIEAGKGISHEEVISSLIKK